MSMLGVALAFGATACTSPGTVCPAIGWINTVEIDASAYGDDAFVQLCVQTRCSVAPGEVETPPDDMSAPGRGDDDAFQFGMSAPDSVTVRVYDASGALLSESEESIAWTRSTDPCGGPATSEPIVLTP